MNPKLKLPGRLNLPAWALLLTVMLVYVRPSHAIIPPSVTGTYTVSVTENCPTTCTIQNGGTLTITGSGASSTFSGSITIMPGGSLIILNGARVKMAAGTKIAVKGNTASLNGGYMQMDNGHITSTAPNVFWSGIETSAGSPLSFANPFPAVVSIGENSGNFSADNLIENAIVGVRNYDSGNPNINATAGGRITIDFTTMRNNIRHLAIYNNMASSIPTNITQTTGNITFQMLFQYVKFINTAGFNPPIAPVDMVYLNNCSNIPLWSCQFHNYNAPAYNTILKGVNAVNAGFFLQAYPNSSNPQTMNRCALTGLGTGVSVTNALQTNRVCIVANTDFDSCTYAISFSGCFKPFVVNTNIHLLQHSAINQGGVYLDNCTGYTVEANKINAVGIKNIFGILPRNSGTAYNEVYRNAIINCEVGVEAMGINRSTNGAIGLKILCNNLSQVYRSGIYVVPSSWVIPPPSFGIASQQQTIVNLTNPPISALASAGNTFRNGSPLTRDFEIFPTSYIVTPYSEIYYRYSPLAAGQKPINTNLLAANIITSFNSTCPVQATGAKATPFPFSIFVQNNTALEKQIRDVKTEAIASTDTSEILSYLYTQQAKLIDSIINYYQYMGYSDTTGKGNYPDSIARVYEQVNTNYEYQVYQAAAYRDLERYDDAIALLNSLAARYQLDAEESRQVAHIVDMYKAAQWLQQNNSDWTNLSGNMKDQVYQYEGGDPMFAGAIARSLLAQYEARSYDPVYIAPEEINTPMSYKVKPEAVNSIYPNPAKDHLLVSYTGDNAVLVLTDMAGREVLRRPLSSSRTIVNIERLPAGMYYAIIWSDATIRYQQKVVKQ